MYFTWGLIPNGVFFACYNYFSIGNIYQLQEMISINRYIVMRKIRNFQWPFSWKLFKNPNFWYLIPLNPRSNIFFKIAAVSFFILLTPNFMQNFTKIWKWLVTELWWTDRRTERRTDRQGRLQRTHFQLSGSKNII